MGQVRKVHVHRLLVKDSVDARVQEIRDHKTLLFDHYARERLAAVHASSVGKGQLMVRQIGQLAPDADTRTNPDPDPHADPGRHAHPAASRTTCSASSLLVPYGLLGRTRSCSVIARLSGA